MKMVRWQLMITYCQYVYVAQSTRIRSWSNIRIRSVRNWLLCNDTDRETDDNVEAQHNKTNGEAKIQLIWKIHPYISKINLTSPNETILATKK